MIKFTFQTFVVFATILLTYAGCRANAAEVEIDNGSDTILTSQIKTGENPAKLMQDAIAGKPAYKCTRVVPKANAKTGNIGWKRASR